jgi:hypothetical protein
MTERLPVEAPDSMSAGYFASHLLSIDSAVLAGREPDELLSGAEPIGNARAASEAVAEVTTPSPITAETPLVLVDEGEPPGQTGVTGAPERMGIIRRPVPRRPLAARSSMHTRAAR